MLKSASREGGCLLRGECAPEGCLLGGICSQGGLLPGGLLQGVSAPGGGVSAPGGGVCSQGGVGVSAGGLSAMGVSAPGGGVSQHVLRQTPPLLTESQTPVKTLPWPNFVAASNKSAFQ